MFLFVDSFFSYFVISHQIHSINKGRWIHMVRDRLKYSSKEGGLGHKARRRFGQNFLTDAWLCDALIAAVDPKPFDIVIEIGPGLGALTRPLLQSLPHLYAVELDRDLAQRLKKQWSSDRLTVYQEDVLNFDFLSCAKCASPEAGKPVLRIVGNLPYNISTPLLLRLMTISDLIIDQHFMLQKEVVERLLSSHGSRTFSRLTVLMQSLYDLTFLFDISPDAFTPRPKVWSSVLRMKSKSVPLVENISSLTAVLSAGFAHRRKMLRSNLLPWLQMQKVSVDGLSLDPNARPETVPLCIWAELANRLFHRSSEVVFQSCAE